MLGMLPQPSPKFVRRYADVYETQVEAIRRWSTDVRDRANLERIVDLLRRFHRGMPAHFDGVPVMFWVFQVLRHYRNLIAAGDSAHRGRLDELQKHPEDRPDPALEDRRIERLFARKVVVEARGTDPDPRRHVPHCGPFEAVAGEGLLGRVEDGLGGFRARASRAHVGFETGGLRHG